MDLKNPLLIIGLIIIIVLLFAGAYVFVINGYHSSHKKTTTTLSTATSTINLNSTTTSASTTANSTSTATTTSVNGSTSTSTSTVPESNYLSINNNAELPPNITTPMSGNYSSGSKVTLNATYLSSGNDYVFSNWTGSGQGSYSGTNQTQQITLSGNITETANYKYYSNYSGGRPIAWASSIINVTYCNPTGNQTNYTDHQLYITYPNQTLYKLYPVVVEIHGGSWMVGNFNLSNPELGRYSNTPDFLRKGYVVVYINYRLAPDWPFPAMIIDSKCAIRFLKANAAKYKFDVNNFAADGGSAGGHLVSLVGLAGPSAGWDVGPYQNYSSSVNVVSDQFGPVNLTANYYIDNYENSSSNVSSFFREVIQRVFPGTSPNNLGPLVNASPIHYVHPGAPPIIIEQGLEDIIVNYTISTQFYNALIAQGDTANIILVQNAGHSFKQVGSNAINPSVANLSNDSADWVAKYFHPIPN